MLTKELISEKLEGVLVPFVMRSLPDMNLVRDINITDHEIKVTLADAAISQDAQGQISVKIKDVIGKADDTKNVEVQFNEMLPKDINQIKYVIAVMSGKGGVGKSLVSSLLAVALRRQGYDVGILDADITGPSIPKMFGLKDRPGGSVNGILPVPSRSGIEIMSINLLLPEEGNAVIWRGPLIGRAITQFWEEVLWGKLDYLIVDLPPGTADAPLTVMQTLPVSGVVIVFTPQDLVDMIVRKAVNMVNQMQKPLLGVVENMSYLYVAELDKKFEIFGKSRAEEMAGVAQAPLLGRLPIDPELAKLCDEGNIERYDAEIMAKFGEAVSEGIPAKKS